ncbi:MAG: hypothetical protein HZA02_10620 [Nitrospinae bacterium]|nr:hypothetical protein [Nitrospinota bacterium]
MGKTNCLAIVAGFLAMHAAAFAEYPDTERFLSPGGNIEVSFQKLEHKKFTEEEFRRDVDNVNHVRYRIEFRGAVTKEAVADAEYADVYGWTAEARPTPPETIFKELIWSPGEHFAIVPASAWASAPGTEQALAVALDPKSPWKSADFYLEDLAWVDDWRVVGDTHWDCEYSVNLFDGHTGLTTPIKQARSPFGYEIRSVEGRNAIVQKALDNCRTAEDKKKFVPACYRLNLDTLKERPAPCPKE